jgi:hypothetical protein
MFFGAVEPRGFRGKYRHGGVFAAVKRTITDFGDAPATLSGDLHFLNSLQL